MMYLYAFWLKFEQISTHKEDFLVDTIALHDSMGAIRPVFADPSICKVFKFCICVSLHCRLFFR